MVYTLEQVKDAYIKLRSYIYHDTTDLHLRRQLVEFETGITKDPLFDIFGKKNSLYGPAKKNRNISYDEKLEYFTERINIYHKDDSYFKTLLDQVGINYYPKKIISSKVDSNFITNKKSREPYHISRTTPFINAPIELHIICVLWIMRSGVWLDAQLGDDCLGNRLILNKEKTELVKGSGLFKPYFKQYQKWRDKSIDHAKKLLNDNRDVAFVNLDIKDYFSSIRLSKKEICDPKNKKHEQRGLYNLEQIFLKIHEIHTEQLISKQLLNIDELDYVLDEKSYVVLPIGLVSSYVLANYYLKSFDDSVNRHIKPTYYARYVDDLLFVIADPKHPDDLDDDEFISPSKISDDFTTLEKFVIENFSPVLDIGIKKDLVDDEKKVIQLTEKRYENLYCQSSKSLAYLFDANESHLVIDKLKEELQERTSEFRDFPDEDENKGSFTDAAYHLQYEDSKDKVRTLKDYKEDRFGLTLFLANKIFSSLRQEEELSDTASNSILKFFKNKTAIEFYRLWEKILTLFLVNNKTKHYVAFYLQCIQEIDQLNVTDELDNIKNEMQKSLAEYLDVANEITLSLNLAFYEKAFQEARDFEFKTQKWKADIFFSIEDYEPTRNDSYWVKRFRKANMIRHHYIIHPLLNFTKGARNTLIKNLVNPHINFSQFELDEGLIRNSPRRINFWECNMAQIFIELCNEIKIANQETKSDIFTLNRITKKSISIEDSDDIEDDKNSELDCLLTDSFNLFRSINENHIPNYEFEEGASASINNIFNVSSTTKKNSPEVWLNEIRVKSDNKQSQFKIAFANTLVEEKNILSSIRGRANLNKDRIKRLGNVIRSARKENADILLFPEFFIPLDLLSSIVDYSKKNEKLVITGLEHIVIGKFAYNFVVTIIPIKVGGVKDAIVIPRLKNHYAHIEKHIIEGNHKMVPSPFMSRYDLIIWKNLYLSNYYCFELANIHHRGLWKNKADLIIGIEWNKDTPYYSNIVEATSRDLHCFFAQVNTSQFGDSRLTKPVQSALKDILRLKGGDNDSLLIATMETKSLREFQRKTFSLTHEDKEFKPLPPDFDVELVLKRINDESVLMS